MNKTDITKENLYISELLLVTRSVMRLKGKPNQVKSRHSDCIFFVCEGECEYTFDDGVHFTARAGDIVYLAHGSAYRMDSSVVYSVIYCDFFFKEELPRSGAIYSVPEAMDADAHFRRLYKYYGSSDADYFYKCMCELYKILGIIGAAKNADYVEPSARERIISAAQYVKRAAADQTMSVGSLAAMLGMSEVYFRRLFRSVMGVSPIKYITKVRLEHARELMAHEYITLEECARESGFASVQYFCRVFKDSYGISPAKSRHKI